MVVAAPTFQAASVLWWTDPLYPLLKRHSQPFQAWESSGIPPSPPLPQSPSSRVLAIPAPNVIKLGGHWLALTQGTPPPRERVKRLW